MRKRHEWTKDKHHSTQDASIQANCCFPTNLNPNCGTVLGPRITVTPIDKANTDIEQYFTKRIKKQNHLEMCETKQTTTTRCEQATNPRFSERCTRNPSIVSAQPVFFFFLPAPQGCRAGVNACGWRAKRGHKRAARGRPACPGAIPCRSLA